MNVTLGRSAEIQLSTLAENGREEVLKWCKKLEHWTPEKWLDRVNPLVLRGREKHYHLKTDSEITLFFVVDPKSNELMVTDIFLQHALDRMAPSLKRVGS